MNIYVKRLSNLLAVGSGICMIIWTLLACLGVFLSGGIDGLLDGDIEDVLMPIIWLACGVLNYMLVGQFRMFYDSNRWNKRGGDQAE